MKRMVFTLVEMLTVIAMVVLLVSMLLPALGQAQRRGEQVSCLGNLRQLTAAMTMYAQDFRWRLPPYMSNSRLGHGGTNWGWYIHSYYENVKVLDCPASPQGPPEDNQEAIHLYDGNYGWNYDGTQGNRGTLYQLVQQPSKGYLLFDSGDPCVIYGGNTWDNLMEELDLDWDSHAEGPNRHNDYIDVTYVDGHAGQLKLLPFLAVPCDSYRAPWYMEWDGGRLEMGHIPYPAR